MAKIHPENHDGFTGNLGPLTVSRWKDKVVVKSRQTGPSRPKTVAQQQASRRFGLLTRFASIAKEYLNEGFKGNPKGNAQHAAIAANMQTGVTGLWPDYRLDYPHLQLSEGSLPSLQSFRADAVAGALHVAWQPAALPADGRLMLMLFNSDREEAVVLTHAAAPDKESLRVSLPAAWHPARIYLYACWVNSSTAGPTAVCGPVCSLPSDASTPPFRGKVATANKKTRRRRRRTMDADWQPSQEDKDHVMELSGVVGPVIFYDYKDIHCLRSRYTVRKEPTEAKRRANQRFAALTRFLRLSNDFLKVGLAAYAATMSQLNAAIKLNYKPAFAASGEGLQIDFSALSLSEGPLPPPQKLSVVRSDTTLHLTWQPSPGAADDILFVTLYHETTAQSQTFMNAATRVDASAALPLSQECSRPGRLHLYAAFRSDPKPTHDPSLVSDSIYHLILIP